MAGNVSHLSLGSTRPAGSAAHVVERMIMRMSEAPTPEDERRRLAPGIAAAMHNVRHADALTPPSRRRRWSLPSDREQSSEDDTR